MRLGKVTKTQIVLLAAAAALLCAQWRLRDAWDHSGGPPAVVETRYQAEQTAPVWEPVNINTADAGTLDTLPGIGPVLAERIIAYREEHGPFDSGAGLMEVKGIGEATYEGLADWITVEGKDRE